MKGEKYLPVGTFVWLYLFLQLCNYLCLGLESMDILKENGLHVKVHVAAPALAAVSASAAFPAPATTPVPVLAAIPIVGRVG